MVYKSTWANFKHKIKKLKKKKIKQNTLKRFLTLFPKNVFLIFWKIKLSTLNLTKLIFQERIFQAQKRKKNFFIISLKKLFLCLGNGSLKNAKTPLWKLSYILKNRTFQPQENLQNTRKQKILIFLQKCFSPFLVFRNDWCSICLFFRYYCIHLISSIRIFVGTFSLE